MFCSKEHMSHKKTERRLRDLPSVQFFPPHPFSHSHVYEPSLFTHTLPTLHGLESHSSTSALKKDYEMYQPEYSIIYGFKDRYDPQTTVPKMRDTKPI